jgi:hypothetical protein
MRFILFSVSVFYLLGLKLTSQVEIKSSSNGKPSTIESKAFPELKHQVQPLELKPELIKKDSASLPETKSVSPAVPSAKNQKNQTFPRS